jgi:hypothetical protein
MYIGNNLQVANPSYKIIDDISSGFNGSTTSFALQVSGATPVPFPINTQQVMISVNGVIQEPDPSGSAGFKLLGSNIVFSSAPANGHAFFGTILAGADYVTAGSEFPDGSVTAPSFTFEADQDSGFFRIGSGDVGYSSNGVQILNYSGNGLTIASGKGLTVDTSTLHVDATNNKVGIGTTSPDRHLTVYAAATTRLNLKSANDSTVGIEFGDPDDINAGYIAYDNSNNGFTVGVNGAGTKLTIDSSGRLLLGTTTEGSANADELTINTASGHGGITIRNDSSSNGNIYFSDGTSGAAEYAGYLQYDHSSNNLRFGSDADLTLTLDSSQRVLMGHTASEAMLLHR